MQFLSRGLSNVGLGTTSTTIPQGSTTTVPLIQLPTSILDSFVPGYSTVSRILYDVFNFDITAVVSVSFLGFALFKAVDFIKQQFMSLVINYATCSVVIPSDVDSYHWIMDWLAHRGIGKHSHHLTALPAANQLTLQELFSLRRGEEEAPPPARKGKAIQKYEPALGLSHYFWHNRTLFLWMRTREKRVLQTSGIDVPTVEVSGTLYCLGRSTEPLKALIDETSSLNYEKTAVKTVIRRPAPAKHRREGGQPWKKAATRPSRPMDTVILEEKEKKSIVQDIEEYLLPETRAWYAQRGIPYRRGYLFHGPPGTGKTSLSFALAGVFGLDVYCISLQEPTITEEDLVTLFEKLPEQCLVLLEDVDSAGLVRENSTIVRNADSSDDPTKSDTRISLSGLLNIIDGVASHEGRVLVMTTNHIENLDNALLRPGRIDVRIEFELATKKHAEDLFLQIFVSDLKKDENEQEILKPKPEITKELKSMSKAFATQIPEKQMSPAEIQGFLINWKKSPSDAVSHSKAWVESTLASTNRG